MGDYIKMGRIKTPCFDILVHNCLTTTPLPFTNKIFTYQEQFGSKYEVLFITFFLIINKSLE
jgi:hypothetical protein